MADARSAQRGGSGLRDLTFAMLESNGSMLASAVETAVDDALLPATPIPGGAATLVLAVSAGDKDPEVTGQ